MVKYNKNILKEEEDIFTYIEKKYGKIKTYNKEELDEISKYNKLNLDIKFINKNNNIKENYKNIQKNYKYIGGEVKNITDNKIITNSSNQIKNKGPNIVLLIIIIITSILVLIYFYKLKLHAIIFPLGLMIVFGMVYNLTTNALISGKNLLDTNKNKKKTNEANESTINLLYYTLLDAPNLLPKFPMIPYPPLDKTPFKNIREGIRSVRINYKIDVDKYKISINIPNIEFDFINPLAAICCAWSYFKKLVDKLIETVINPFCNFVLDNIYNPIKNQITNFKNKVIDPIIDGIMTIYKTLTGTWDTLRNKFLDAIKTFISAVSKIPGFDGLLDPQIKLIETKQELDKQKKKKELALLQGEKLKGRNEMKIKEIAAKLAYNKYAGNIKKLIKTQKQKGGLFKKMEDYKNKAYTKYCKKIDKLIAIKYPKCKVKTLKKINIKNDINKYNNKLKKNVQISRQHNKLTLKKINYLLKHKKIIDVKLIDLYYEINKLNKPNTQTEFYKHISKIKRKINIIRNIIKFSLYNKYTLIIKELNFIELKLNKFSKNLKIIIKGGVIGYIKKGLSAADKLKNAVASAAKSFGKAVVGVTKSLAEHLVKALNKLALAALKEVKKLIEQVKKKVDEIMDDVAKIRKFPSHLTKVKNIFKEIATFFSETLPNKITEFGTSIAKVGKKIGEVIPGLFEKIGKIIFNIIKIIGWFLKIVVMKGFKLIKAIIDFIIELGKKTGQKISIPKWATTDDPILQIPDMLKYVKQVIDLPFKSFFEKIIDNLNNIKNKFSKIGDWINSIINGIKSGINSTIKGIIKTIKATIDGIKITFATIKSKLNSIKGINLGNLLDVGLLNKLNEIGNFDESKFTL